MSTKYSRRKRYPEFMRFVASLTCVVCGRHPVEVAHVGERAFGQKCSDTETLPLCVEHHREGKFSQHRLGKHFWKHHGIEKAELIARLQRAYEQQFGKAA